MKGQSPEIKEMCRKLAEAAEMPYHTPEDAIKAGCCIQCGQKISGRIYSDAGQREYIISGTCEFCFDALFADTEDGSTEEHEEHAF